MEAQRRARIGVELAGLAALVVRVEGEGAAHEAAKEHHAHAGRAVGRGGRERHGLGHVGAARDGLREPLLEKSDWIGPRFEARCAHFSARPPQRTGRGLGRRSRGESADSQRAERTTPF